MYPFPEMREFFPPLTPGSVFIVSSTDSHLAHAVIRAVELSWRSQPGINQLDLPLVPLRREGQSWENYLAQAHNTAQRADSIAFLPVSNECPTTPVHPTVFIEHGDAGLLNLALLWNGRRHNVSASYRLSDETGAIVPARYTDLYMGNLLDELFVIEPSAVVEEAKPRLHALMETQPEVFRDKLHLGEGNIRLTRIECLGIDNTENHISATLALYVDANQKSTARTITATGIPDGYGGFASFHLEF